MPVFRRRSRHSGISMMAVNLVFYSKNGRRKDITLDDGVTIVGRRPDCDIRIPLLYVSRKHCRFIRKEEQTVVQDLGSANGTFLNSERIMEAVVGPGDKVGVGSVTFTVQIDGEPSEIGQSAAPAAAGENADRDIKQAPPDGDRAPGPGRSRRGPGHDRGDPLFRWLRFASGASLRF